MASTDAKSQQREMQRRRPVADRGDLAVIGKFGDRALELSDDFPLNELARSEDARHCGDVGVVDVWLRQSDHIRALSRYRSIILRGPSREIDLGFEYSPFTDPRYIGDEQFHFRMHRVNMEGAHAQCRNVC